MKQDETLIGVLVTAITSHPTFLTAVKQAALAHIEANFDVQAALDDEGYDLPGMQQQLEDLSHDDEINEDKKREIAEEVLATIERCAEARSTVVEGLCRALNNDFNAKKLASKLTPWMPVQDGRLDDLLAQLRLVLGGAE